MISGSKPRTRLWSTKQINGLSRPIGPFNLALPGRHGCHRIPAPLARGRRLEAATPSVCPPIPSRRAPLVRLPVPRAHAAAICAPLRQEPATRELAHDTARLSRPGARLRLLRSAAKPSAAPRAGPRVRPFLLCPQCGACASSTIVCSSPFRSIGFPFPCGVRHLPHRRTGPQLVVMAQS